MKYLRILKDYVHRMKVLEKIYGFCFELTHKVPGDSIVIVCAQRGGLGDTLYMCGLANELLIKHKKERMIIYMKPSHFFIAYMFPNIEPKAIPTWFKANYLENIFWNPSKVFFAHFSFSARKFIGFKSITLLDSYKAIMGLPSHTHISQKLPITKNHRKYAEEIFDSYNLTKGKTCIIVPEARSSPDLSVDQITMICDHVKRNGLTPVLMCLRSNPLTNYTNINVPLEVIDVFFEIAGHSILVRSGLCDILSLTSCSMTILYPDIIWEGGKFIEGTSLLSSKLNESAKEYLIADYINTIK